MQAETKEIKPTTIVVLNENEQRGEKMYCTMLFKFGFINSHATSLNTSKEALINQAATLLFAEYISDTLMRQVISGKCFAQANILTVHFDVLQSNALSKLKNLLSALFAESVSEEEFTKLKERAFESFSKRYADTKYRAFLKILEVCGYEAGFRLEELVKSLEGITFEDYISHLDKMLHPGNLVVFFDGKVEDLSQDAVLKLLPPTFTEEAGKDWSAVSIPKTATVLDDNYSSELFGDKEMYAFALKFYFGEVTSSDMFIFLLFASAALDVPAVMILDGHMPSIICLIEEECEVDASLLKNLDEERFESLKLSCEMLLSSTFEDPQNFGEIVVQALAQGVSIFEIYAGFVSISFEDVVGFIEGEYPQIRKGLVRVRKIGEGNGQ